MAINISTDINVTTGGKLSDIGQIQGGWRTVDNESDMYALTASATTKQLLQNGMIFYVSASNSLYTLDIAGSFPIVTYNFNSFSWPGGGGGGGATDISALNTFTGSIQTQVDALEAATGSYILASQTSSMTVLSASYAVSSSHEIITEVSSSHAILADTASFISDNFISASAVRSGFGAGSTDISSLNIFTGSIQTQVNTIQAVTGSFAITGSNTFIGNQTIDGILILTTQSSEPTYVSGGLYLDSNYNLYLGGS